MKVIDLTMTRDQKETLLRRLDALMDEVPVTEQEAEEVLAELGIDAEAAWRQTDILIAQWEVKEMQKKLGDCETTVKKTG